MRDAGGIGLQSLVDHLADRLQKVVSEGLASWQCQAASVVTVLSEVVFGASLAWHPTVWLEAGCQGVTDTAVLQQLVEQLQENFTQDRLWSIPSQLSALPPDVLPLSPQVKLTLLSVQSL